MPVIARYIVGTIITWHAEGAQKKKNRHLRTNFVFHSSRGGRGVRRPHPPPITPHNFRCKEPPFYILYNIGAVTLQGQVLDYIADTQPPGRAAAACVPDTHSAEQRRRRERATEIGHNEHSFHGEGTPAQPSFDKTAWLQSVCGKPADGEQMRGQLH